MADTERLMNKAQGDDIISALATIAANILQVPSEKLIIDWSYTTLPASGNDHTIYAIPTGDADDPWDFYVWNDVDEEWVQFDWNFVVDSTLSTTSENPVQNKVITAALDTKVDKVTGKGLSTNDYTTEEKNKLARIEAGIIYGMHIDGTESDPDAKITYLADAVGMIPAYMDFTKGEFNYGSWGDAFFMPRPCMLRSNGFVDYYLKPTDLTKKLDETASDVANTSYDGNAMMEWGQLDGSRIWLKIVPDANGIGASVYIADHRADPDFHDWAFHNYKSQSSDFFYTPIYNGSVISDKMRSLSGQQVSNNLNATQERTAAQLNNPTDTPIWDIETFADITLINFLAILITKSTDGQGKFGQGLNSGGTEALNNDFRTGVHDDKGLFYGTNSGTISSTTYGNAVKIFGMENWWGFQWRRYIGHVMVNGVQKAKLTYGQEDGSTTTGYNLTGDGYKTENSTAPTGTSGSYIKSFLYTEDSLFLKDVSGSSTTYYEDGGWFNNSITAVPIRSANSTNGAHCGSFAVALTNTASNANWHVGASLSCHPTT